MKKPLAVALMIPFVVGCSKGIPGFTSSFSPPVSGVDQTNVETSELSSLFNSFQSLKISYGVTTNYPTSLNVVFGDLGFTLQSGGVNGVCEKYSDGSRIVRYDRTFWSIATPAQKEILAFHELGHCILDRSHRSMVDSGGHPLSVMFPSTISGTYYSNNYSYFLNELFTFHDSASEGEPVEGGGPLVHLMGAKVLADGSLLIECVH